MTCRLVNTYRRFEGCLCLFVFLNCSVMSCLPVDRVWSHSRCGSVSKSVFFLSWRYNPHCGCILQPSSGLLASSRTRLLDHTQRRATVCRTSLDEWSIRRRDLYLTTHNTRNRQTSMPRVGFEPTISAGERPKTYALDRAATGTGIKVCLKNLKATSNI